MVGFKLEQLLLFDRTDKAALILAFLLYLPASYYFHAVRKDTGIRIRLLTFFGLTLIYAAVIHFYSGVSHPFLYIVNYGISIPLGLTVIFILLTGHEVIYGFLVLITRNNTPESSNSFIHFLALSLIFLVNVLLLYLKNTRRIDWDFYYLDAFWILIAAGIIGIWSLRERGPLFKNIMPVVPHALVGYLILAIISFTTIGYFFATANDPAIEALEDAVVFSQLCIGFLFLVYILFNFKGVLLENLKVYKVVYKPRKMPFFSMRLAGAIGVLGLFLLANQYPLDQAITAYYNGIGDLHRIDQQRLLAKEYYKLAAIYAKTNHRSNYAIAAMEIEDRNLGQALAYYKQSTIKQPTAFAFVNTARAYEEQGRFFDAMFSLKDGLKKFPEEPHIANNLATLYGRTNLLDSAYYFLEQLDQKGNLQVSRTIQSNKLAFVTRSQLEVSLDSVKEQINYNYPEIGSNLLVMANNQNQDLVLEPGILKDSLLNPMTFAWWYNFQLNQRQSNDSQQIALLERYWTNPQNELFRDRLQLATAVRWYYTGDLKQAFRILRDLQFRDSGKAGLYNDILGQWSLQQGQANLALDYFTQGVNAGYLPALEHQALTLLALGRADEAIQNWNTYRYRSRDTLNSNLNEIMQFVGSNQMEWTELTDREKSWYLRFKAIDLAMVEQAKMIAEIHQEDLRNQTSDWLWDQALSAGQTTQPGDLIPGTEHPLRKLQMAIALEEYDNLDQLIAGVDASRYGSESWILLGQAIHNQHQGALDKAEQNFQQLTKNPFFEPGILHAAANAAEISGDEFSSYNIILDALSFNPYSVELLMAYGEYCTRLNLDTYTQSTLDTLKGLLSDEDYSSYLRTLERIENEVNRGFMEDESI
jgi:predicted Zn-dependent protease